MKPLSLNLLLVLGVLMFTPVQAASQIVILQYHHVDHGTPASTSITPELFDEHINYLQENDYIVWPLEDAVKAIRNNEPLPERAVAITIDDAYRSVYEEIYPRLKKLGWSFTVFVNAQPHDEANSHYITWEQMREMQQHGAVFANHTYSHLHMLRKLEGEDDAAWLRRMKLEVELGQQRLLEELGQAPMLFAYPYGEHNPAIRKLIADQGYAGFGQQSGPAGASSDFTVLPRFPMAAGFAGMRRFPEKLDTHAFPIISVEPQDTVLAGDDSLPVLRLTLEKGHYRPGAMTCYISGQGRGSLEWQGDTLMVKPKQPLPVGRSRYNCTAPNTKGSGYYWYSHSWFKKKPDGSWYRE